MSDSVTTSNIRTRPFWSGKMYLRITFFYYWWPSNIQELESSFIWKSKCMVKYFGIHFKHFLVCCTLMWKFYWLRVLSIVRFAFFGSLHTVPVARQRRVQLIPFQSRPPLALDNGVRKLARPKRRSLSQPTNITDTKCTPFRSGTCAHSCFLPNPSPSKPPDLEWESLAT